MAQASVTHVMIIKVDFEGDVRRISTELPEDASRAQTLQAIRTAVAQGFDIDGPVVGASFPVLKYRDEEGDLCTLVEASVDDMLEFAKCGTLRLFMSTTHTVVVQAIVKAEMPHGMPEFTGVTEMAADTASEKEDAVAADAAALTEVAAVDDAQEEAAAEEVAALKVAEESPVERPEAWGPELMEDPIEASSEEGSAAEEDVAEDLATTGVATAEANTEVGRVLTAKASCLRRLQLLEESATENAAAVAAVAEEVATVEAAAEEPESEQPNELDNTLEGSAGYSAPAENASMPRPEVKNATRMDHAQVFLSKSIGGLRSLASTLLKSDRPDPWRTVPSTAAANDDTAAAATDDAAVAAAASSAAAHNVIVAEAMSIAQFENAEAVQIDTSDEFLCVSVDPSDTPAVRCQITGVMTTK